MITVSSPKQKLSTASAKSNNTIYQAEADGFITAFTDNTSNSASVFIDVFTPPTTQVTGSRTENTGSGNGCCYPIRKGEYYKITDSTAAEFTKIV